MSRLFRFEHVCKRNPSIDAWLVEQPEPLATIASHWFEMLRGCGADVHELLHDGHPTACVDDVAFAYVNAFKAHVNVGFFHGAELADPHGLLQGTGKYMRHVKIRPGEALDAPALRQLVHTAYEDMQVRLRAI